MVDFHAVRAILSAENAAWASFAVICLFIFRMWNGAPAMFEQWVAYKRAKAEEKSSDWQRLRDENKRIDDRCIRLEQSEEQCRKELADIKGRVAMLEGYQVGVGEARQQVAIIEGAERIIEHERKEEN
jgi:hypothetical protein